jgi:hypothetical protein
MDARIKALAEKLRAERQRVQNEPNVCHECGRDGPLADAAWDLALAVLEEPDVWRSPGGLWLCGCLINDGGAHRVGCPEHPEGVKGWRLS